MKVGQRGGAKEAEALERVFLADAKKRSWTATELITALRKQAPDLCSSAQTTRVRVYRGLLRLKSDGKVEYYPQGSRRGKWSPVRQFIPVSVFSGILGDLSKNLGREGAHSRGLVVGTSDPHGLGRGRIFSSFTDEESQARAVPLASGSNPKSKFMTYWVVWGTPPPAERVYSHQSYALGGSGTATINLGAPPGQAEKKAAVIGFKAGEGAEATHHGLDERFATPGTVDLSALSSEKDLLAPLGEQVKKFLDEHPDMTEALLQFVLSEVIWRYPAVIMAAPASPSRDAKSMHSTVRFGLPDMGPVRDASNAGRTGTRAKPPSRRTS